MTKNAAPPCGAPRRRTPVRLVWAVVLFTLLAGQAYGQADARLTAIKANLQALEVESPGLSEKTELSVSGIPLDEFLQAVSWVASPVQPTWHGAWVGGQLKQYIV